MHDEQESYKQMGSVHAFMDVDRRSVLFHGGRVEDIPR